MSAVIMSTNNSLLMTVCRFFSNHLMPFVSLILLFLSRIVKCRHLRRRR